MTGAPENGLVEGIYIAPEAGADMQALARGDAIAGDGLAGDRYRRTAARGHWSYEPRYVSEITLVEAEAVERVAAALGVVLAPPRLRRNVVTRGIALQPLIGRRFAIGDAVFEGERPCDPCGYLDRLLDLRVKALLGRDGGLRARIVTGGAFARGDTVRVI